MTPYKKDVIELSDSKTNSVEKISMKSERKKRIKNILK
jgi:hypothetical protein